MSNFNWNLKAVLFFIGRALLGLSLIVMGSSHFTRLGQLTEQAEAANVIYPGVAVVVTGLLLLMGGVTILVGFKPNVGVVALIAFFVPVTLWMHPFWAAEPGEDAAQAAAFMKNMALMGASLALLGVPRPWPVSVDRRLSEAQERVREAVAVRSEAMDSMRASETEPGEDERAEEEAEEEAEEPEKKTEPGKGYRKTSGNSVRAIE